MSTIGEYLGTRNLNVSPNEKALITAGLLPKSSVLDTNKFIGIEIELENVDRTSHVEGYRMDAYTIGAHKKDPSYPVLDLWYSKADGSLRNNGVEFVSHPIRLGSLKYFLEHLYGYIRSKYPNAAFTERCGIHFHFNFLNHTADRVFSFLMVYAAFEKYIFRFVGGDRELSNFCIPIQNQNITNFRCFQSNRASHTGYFLDNIPSSDNAKYSAMNICRLRDLGTIEARHLPGTWDIEHLVKFATIIQRIKDYAVIGDNWDAFCKHAAVINSDSSYRQLLDEIFGDLSYSVCPNDDYSPLEHGITYVKQQLILVKDQPFKRVSYLDAFQKPEFNQKMAKFISKRSVQKTGLKSRPAYPPDIENEDGYQTFNPQEMRPEPEIRTGLRTTNPMRIDPEAVRRMQNDLRAYGFSALYAQEAAAAQANPATNLRQWTTAAIPGEVTMNPPPPEFEVDVYQPTVTHARTNRGGNR